MKIVYRIAFAVFNKGDNKKDVVEKTDLSKQFDKKSKANIVVFPHYDFMGEIKSNKTKVLILHDLMTVSLEELFKRSNVNIKEYNKELIKRINSFLEKDNSYLVVPTEYMLKIHIAKFLNKRALYKSRIITFPAMIFNELPTVAVSKEQIIDKFKMNSDQYIFIASQNRPNKNWDVILKALGELKSKKINLNFVTTGKIDSLQSTKQIVEAFKLSNQIVEVGNICDKDLYYLYKYSSMSISSSVLEGLGITSQILEPLVVGNIPIIAVKSLGIEESLHSVGLNFNKAKLNWVKVNDYKSMANKIESVLKDPKTHIEKQKNIIEFYKKNSWDRVATKFLNYFGL